MSYPLPAPARAWRDKVRRFVAEELIPHEVAAEMNGGVLAPEITARHKRIAKEIGLSALAIPRELGGAGLSFLEQVVIQEEKLSENPSTENAYRTLRDARSEARLIGKREKRAKAKAEEEENKKK